MTDKAVENLTHKLHEKGIDDTEILEIIEYIETHDRPDRGQGYVMLHRR